jgi:hypothetical protein
VRLGNVLRFTADSLIHQLINTLQQGAKMRMRDCKWQRNSRSTRPDFWVTQRVCRDSDMHITEFTPWWYWLCVFLAYDLVGYQSFVGLGCKTQHITLTTSVRVSNVHIEICVGKCAISCQSRPLIAQTRIVEIFPPNNANVVSLFSSSAKIHNS